MRRSLSVLVVLSGLFASLDAGAVRASDEGGLFGTPTERSERPLRLGLRIGALLADLAYSEDLPETETAGSLLSWRVGLDARQRLSPAVDFLTGLHYVRKGGTVETVGSITILGFPFEADLNSEFVFHYLSLPVGVQVGRPGPGLRPFVRGGLELALLVSSRGTVEGTLVDEEGLRSNLDGESELSNTREIDVGLDAGVGLEIPWERRSLIVELGGTLGLTDAAEHGDGSKHRTLGLSAGVRF